MLVPRINRFQTNNGQSEITCRPTLTQFEQTTKRKMNVTMNQRSNVNNTKDLSKSKDEQKSRRTFT